MDLSRVLDMVIKTVVRRLVGRGVDAGINLVAGRGKPAADPTAADLSPEERQQAKAAKAAAKRARQAASVTRRLGK
ncbi:MAG: hypothetical protein ACT4N9_04705 [Paracoccaceae bacterium]